MTHLRLVTCVKGRAWCYPNTPCMTCRASAPTKKEQR